MGPAVVLVVEERWQPGGALGTMLREPPLCVLAQGGLDEALTCRSSDGNIGFGLWIGLVSGVSDGRQQSHHGCRLEQCAV